MTRDERRGALSCVHLPSRRVKSSRDVCGRATRRLSPLASRLSLGEYPLQREHESFNLVFRVVMRERDSNDALPASIPRSSHRRTPYMLPFRIATESSLAAYGASLGDTFALVGTNDIVGTRTVASEHAGPRIRIAQRSRSDTSASIARRAGASSSALAVERGERVRPVQRPSPLEPEIVVAARLFLPLLFPRRAREPAEVSSHGDDPRAQLVRESSSQFVLVRIISRVDEIVVGSLHGGESSIRPEERARVRPEGLVRTETVPVHPQSDTDMALCGAYATRPR